METANARPDPTSGRWRVSDEVPVGGGSGPTVRRMLLGAQLRRLRSEAGLSREQAGAAIRASEWKIHIYVMESIGLRSAPPHRTPDILPGS